MKNEKIEKDEIQDAINTIKKRKEEVGAIPVDNKKIVVVENGKKNFSGMALKRAKSVIKNNVCYSYKAGTKWEEIDEFGKKNIDFNENDFN